MTSYLKSQHFKLYLKLKQQECLIEKSVETFIVNSKNDVEQWRVIKRDIDNYDCERKKLTDAFKETITAIYEELKLLKSMVTKENVGKIDIESFKVKLQSLWKRIQDFKVNSNNADAIIEEQNSLDADLNALIRIIRKHKNFNSTENFQYNKTTASKPRLQKEDSVKECDYDEAEDFCTLLAKTGHTGSWSEEDHLLFVKYRKKHKTIPSLVLAIQGKCPDLSRESIINHEAWYKTYLDLREKQKLAVQDWRKRRETERLAKIETRKFEDDNKDDNHLLRVAEHKKAEVERKKERVKKWKEEREKLKAAEEKQIMMNLRARRELNQKRQQLRANKIKKLVAEYKEKKNLEKKEDERTEQVNRVPSSMSALIFQIYRARDQEYIEKRKSVCASKTNHQKHPMQMIHRDYPRITESTLFKETIAWQEKHKTIAEPKLTRSVSYIKDLPKRTVVTWKSFDIPSFQDH